LIPLSDFNLRLALPQLAISHSLTAGSCVLYRKMKVGYVTMYKKILKVKTLFIQQEQVFKNYYSHTRKWYWFL